MCPIKHIFLDDDGVMNDSARRRLQWMQLVGEFFAPQLGGEAQQWSEADGVVLAELLAVWENRNLAGLERRRKDDAFVDQLRWLRRMCELVGVDAPADEAQCVALADACVAYVTPRTHAAYPGAVEAIRRLSHLGFVLRTASGEDSSDLDSYLRGMGVRSLFQGLYGPDLVDTQKTSPHYYERIFAHAGVDPAQALVVDDRAFCLDWARQVGARTVLVESGSDPGAVHARIQALAELPALLDAAPLA